MFAQTKYRSAFLVDFNVVQNGLIVLLASIVLAAISQISIPWTPVPLTFQSAMVILLGLTLGSKRAAATVALYLFEGACGLPVFAELSGGLHVLVGPTAGYLWGMLLAAFLSGWLMEKGMAKNIFRIFSTSILSAVIIFVFGVLYLSDFVGFSKAMTLGVLPFLMTEPVKLIISSVITKGFWKQNM